MHIGDSVYLSCPGADFGWQRRLLCDYRPIDYENAVIAAII